MADEIAEKVIEKLGKAKGLRLNWESYWEEVAEYVLPNFANTFTTGGYPMVQGRKNDRKRYDGSAEIANSRLASTMESILTPRNSTWHGITTDNIELNRLRNVREWQDAVTAVLFKYRYMPAANFASQNYEHFMALGAFGTGCMYADKLTPRGFRYNQIHIAQIYFYENHQGIIDEALRPFKLTAKNAIKKFGENKVSEEIKKADMNNSQEMFEFIHCVCPREDVDYQRKDFKGKLFASYYVDVRGRKLVREEGYDSFPFCVSRFITAPGELYGRSPAMQALTNIKVLNQQKKTILKQGHRAADPILLAHDDGILDTFSGKPGSVIPGSMTGDGKRLVDVLPTGNVAITDKLMQIERDEIAAAFMTDLFQLFTERPQMTATEVVELAREKGILYAPIMGRQESEYLSTLVSREMDLANMQGLLPPMPPELIEAGGEYKIVFDNPLSRAQKAEQSAGLMRTVGWAAEIAAQTQDPAPLDWFDWDVIVPELAYNNAVPTRYIKSPNAVTALRQGRSQQIETQQVIEAGPTIAALAKNK